MSQSLPRFPVHWHLGEPNLIFHPDRVEDKHPHPLLGLLQYGPFSRSVINCVMDPIRVAVMTPHRDQRKGTSVAAGNGTTTFSKGTETVSSGISRVFKGLWRQSSRGIEPCPYCSPGPTGKRSRGLQDPSHSIG